jgi:hypothetical protein
MPGGGTGAPSWASTASKTMPSHGFRSRALWNLLLRGDEEDVPVGERDWYSAVLEEPDPERQLRLNAHNSRTGKLRFGALLEVIASAAHADPEIAGLWDRIQTEYRENREPSRPVAPARRPLRLDAGRVRAVVRGPRVLAAAWKPSTGVVILSRWRCPSWSPSGGAGGGESSGSTGSGSFCWCSRSAPARAGG